MITARSSRANKRAAALTLVLMVGGAGSTSAHRRDEYLQAARIAIGPARVQLTLDLTPGISVAEDVLAAIDRDGDRTVSPNEARTYARELLRAVALDIDGADLRLELVHNGFPAVDAMLNGEGTMRIDAAARLPPLANGAHHLRYRNSHRSDIGVYLANALVPETDRVAVTAQRRDVDQRELTIDYVLAPASAPRARALSIVAASAFTALAVRWRRRRARNSNRSRVFGRVRPQEDLC